MTIFSCAYSIEHCMKIYVASKGRVYEKSVGWDFDLYISLPKGLTAVRPVVRYELSEDVLDSRAVSLACQTT